MRLLIVDQCSGSKDYRDDSPVFDADDIDERSRKALLEQDGVAAKKARNLYTGRQQEYVNEAVDALRNAGHHVDRYFISAGFGLVEESTELPPYEVTFNEMSGEEVQTRADSLGISDAVRELVSADPPYDVIFFALGNDYFSCLDFDEIATAVPKEAYVVLFNQEATEEDFNNLISISARVDDAKEHGSIVVALKGTYLKNFADHVAKGAEIDSLADIATYCTAENTQQTDLNHYD